jgi:putative MATE family efflux protein
VRWLVFGAYQRSLLGIGVPAALRLIVSGLVVLAEAYWVGQLGTESLGGLAAGDTWWLVLSASSRVTVGGSMGLLAQAVGSDDRGRRDARFWQACHMAVAVALVVGGGALLSLDVLLRWQGLTGETLEACKSFLIVMIFGLPWHGLNALASLMFDSNNASRTDLAVHVAGMAVNVCLLPVLVLGWGGAPQLGTSGAALAMVASWVLVFAARLILLQRSSLLGKLTAERFWASGAHLQVLRIGLPIGGTHVVWAIVYPLLASVVVTKGPDALAGMILGTRVAVIPYYAGVGLSVAVAALVGRAYGARQLNAVTQVVREGESLALVVGLPLTLVCLVFPEDIMDLLVQERAVHEHASNYLRIVGSVSILQISAFVYEGSFNGLGKTKAYSLMTSILVLSRYPLAYGLVAIAGFPVQAVWWCFAVTILARAIVMKRLFRHHEVKLIEKRGVPSLR